MPGSKILCRQSRLPRKAKVTILYTQDLNFPEYPFRLRSENGADQIFDEVRKKWVVLTPEEWVRQHLIAFFIHDKKVPAGLVSVEKTLIYQGMQRRYDLAIFSRNAEPLLLAECKAPQIRIDKSVFDQAAIYNTRLGVRFFVVTNGIQIYCCAYNLQESRWVFLNDLPDFEMLSGEN